MKKRSDNTIKYLILGVILVSMLFYLSQSNFLGFATIKIETPIYNTDFSNAVSIKITNPDSLTKDKVWGLTSLATIGDFGDIKDVLRTSYLGKAALNVNVDNLRTYDIKVDATRIGGLSDAKVDVEFFNNKGNKISTVPKIFTISNNVKKNIFFNINPPTASTSMKVILSNFGQTSINWFVQWDNFDITEIRTAQTSCEDTDVVNDITKRGVVAGVNKQGVKFGKADVCEGSSVRQYSCNKDKDNFVDNGKKVCVNGCLDGACKKAVPIVCGDGKKEGNEQCDDRNNLNGDGCSATCVIEVQTAVCGDGKKEGNEQCDDRNNLNGDGCSATCVIEVQVCDNDKLCESGETLANCPYDCDVTQQCDDGNNCVDVRVCNDNGMCDSAAGETTLNCFVTDCIPTPFCGDKIIQGGLGEKCDDGNKVNGDGCSATCDIETVLIEKDIIENNVVVLKFGSAVNDKEGCVLEDLALTGVCKTSIATYVDLNGIVAYRAGVENRERGFTNDEFINAIDSLKSDSRINKVNSLNVNGNNLFILESDRETSALWYRGNYIIFVVVDGQLGGDETLLLRLGKAYLNKYPSDVILLNGVFHNVLEEGEKKIYTINGKEYEVEAVLITNQDPKKTVVFRVNGEQTSELSELEGDVEVLSDGIRLGVSKIVSKSGVDSVKFYIGVSSCGNGNCQIWENEQNCASDCLVDNDYLIKNDVGKMKFIEAKKHLGLCEGTEELNLNLAGNCNTFVARYGIANTPDIDVNVEIRDTAFTNDEFLTAVKNSNLERVNIINNNDGIKGSVIVSESNIRKKVNILWFKGKQIINIGFEEKPNMGEEGDFVGLINAYLGKYSSDVVDKCMDSDNGKNYYLGGKIETTFESLTDMCGSYGAEGHNLNLFEGYCEPDGDIRQEYRQCEYGCVLDADGFGKCKGDGTLVTCTDDDNGLDYSKKGKVTAGTFAEEDYCVQYEKALIEWSCAGNGAFEVNKRPCKCEDGKCVGTVSDGVLVEEDIGELKLDYLYTDNGYCRTTGFGLNLPGSCETSNAGYMKKSVNSENHYNVNIEQRDVSFTQEEFTNSVEGYVDKNGNNFVPTVINDKKVYLLDDYGYKTVLWNNGKNIIYLNGDNKIDLDEIAKKYLEKYPSELTATDSLPLQVEVYVGWNLIFGLEHPSQVGTDEVKSGNIKAIYALLPSQEYARLYPTIENDKLNNIDKLKLKNGAFWVYSNQAGKMSYKIFKKGLMRFDKRSMHKKWNFVGVSPDILDLNTKIKNLAGNCVIEKAYYFDPQTQGWAAISLDDPYKKLLDVKGYNAVLKMADNCQMGNLPPGLPTE